LAGAPAVRLVEYLAVGRLENIIARNQRPNRPRERIVVSLSFGAILLLIIGLMLFTDLGLPPGAAGAGQAVPAPARTAPAGHVGKHVDGVLLRAPAAAKPAPP
jgi:hypothetical protein